MNGPAQQALPKAAKPKLAKAHLKTWLAVDAALQTDLSSYTTPIQLQVFHFYILSWQDIAKIWGIT